MTSDWRARRPVPQKMSCAPVRSNESWKGQDERKAMTIDFVAIATPLVERGFRVTPVHPETKSGVMRNWQNHQATTPDEVLRHAKY